MLARDRERSPENSPLRNELRRQNAERARANCNGRISWRHLSLSNGCASLLRITGLGLGLHKAGFIGSVGFHLDPGTTQRKVRFPLMAWIAIPIFTSKTSNPNPNHQTNKK